MAGNDAINWKPGDPTYTNPYARDFGSTPSGFDRSMLRKRGFNWDFGAYGDMDDDSRHLAMIGRGGGTGSTSIGSGGGWLGSGSVNIPGARGISSGGREANFSTLSKVTGFIPRTIKRGIKAFNTLAGAGQANKLADLADQKQQLMGTISANQKSTAAQQTQYANSYLGGSWDPYSQAYANAANSGPNASYSNSTYGKTRPQAGAGGAAKAKATKAPTTQKPVKPKAPKGPRAPKGPNGPKGPPTNKPVKPAKPAKPTKPTK